MMTNERRQAIESQIVRAILTKAKKSGFEILLNNGDEIIPLNPFKTVTRMLAECKSVDEESITLIDPANGKRRSIHLVYGNTGFDVICDYNTNLHDWLADINNMAERIAMKMGARG